MEFSYRETVIKAMKDYTIQKCLDYRMYESELTTFYAKCTQYGAGCNWLIRVSKMWKKSFEARFQHNCRSNKAVGRVDPSIKVKSVIAEVQSKFNYTINYCKAWLAKQKTVESIFRGWEAFYEALSI
ncbi:hypothetical protein Ahy_B07g087839 [Arachis hypogaea]|uniref:Transposase MuDR plant domain-containing protein n=1 Tax=Arachis hypogaea TaxID=3818 RepID=A0A444YD19_ARAHY|nr:hypothetical protein Ahy_B07g087839 [Arachis hypogaea]